MNKLFQTGCIIPYNLTMRTFRDSIYARIKQLEQLIDAKEQALAGAPDGFLKICGSNRDKLYHVNGNVRKYMTHDTCSPLPGLLAQKSYDADVLRCARKELRLLKKVYDRYPSPGIEGLYEDLSPVRRELVRPVITPDDEFIASWINTPYLHKPFDNDTPVILTGKGERVRSKSEKIIADFYDSHGVPYKYECPLTGTDGRVLYPDFTLLSVRRRTVIYHEHFGMSDDPDYLVRNMPRLFFYEDLGILLGDNLIITCETKNRPFNTTGLEEMIKRIL